MPPNPMTDLEREVSRLRKELAAVKKALPLNVDFFSKALNKVHGSLLARAIYALTKDKLLAVHYTRATVDDPWGYVFHFAPAKDSTHLVPIYTERPNYVAEWANKVAALSRTNPTSLCESVVAILPLVKTTPMEEL